MRIIMCYLYCTMLFLRALPLSRDTNPFSLWLLEKRHTLLSHGSFLFKKLVNFTFTVWSLYVSKSITGYFQTTVLNGCIYICIAIYIFFDASLQLFMKD